MDASNEGRQGGFGAAAVFFHLGLMAPDICPVCSAEVPSNARACPECGADEQTGWSEKARYDDLGIPDDSFDYDEFVRKEFEGEAPSHARRRFWRIAGIVLLLVFLLPVLYYFIAPLLNGQPER